jgi:hypothetical protein
MFKKNCIDETRNSSDDLHQRNISTEKNIYSLVTVIRQLYRTVRQGGYFAKQMLAVYISIGPRQPLR